MFKFVEYTYVANAIFFRFLKGCDFFLVARRACALAQMRQHSYYGRHGDHLGQFCAFFFGPSPIMLHLRFGVGNVVRRCGKSPIPLAFHVHISTRTRIWHNWLVHHCHSTLSSPIGTCFLVWPPPCSLPTLLLLSSPSCHFQTRNQSQARTDGIPRRSTAQHSTLGPPSMLSPWARLGGILLLSWQSCQTSIK